VTEMMKRGPGHLGVNSRFSPKAILILRKIARGWGGILESPPWGRNEPTGHSGPLGRPHQLRGRMPCAWHAPAQGLGVIGTQYRRNSNRAGPGTCHTPDGSCALSAWPDGTARWVLPHFTICGVSLSGYSSLPMAERLSAPAPVAEIARLQVVSAAPHAYQPDDARVRLPRSVGSVPAPYSFDPRPCVAALLGTAGEPSKTPQRSARGEGRCDRCSTIDLSKRPSVFSS